MKVKDIWLRQGMVKISRGWIEEQPVELAEKIMSNLIVFRCEYFLSDDSLIMHAISREFDKIEVGVDPPKYNVEIEDIEGGGYKLDFKNTGEVALW